MRPLIVFRPAASEEVDETVAYLAQDSPHIADRFLTAVELTCRELAEMPGLGHCWEPALDRLLNVRTYRVKDFQNWLVFYRPTDRGIEILHVLHGARDLDSILDEPIDE